MTETEKAVNRAMQLLTARDYTEKQLRDKLLKYFEEQETAAAVAYVKSYHYLDDVRYADNYLEYYKDFRSYRRMEVDLMKKGIARDVIRACWEDKLEQGCDYDEGEQIRRLLEKRHFNPGTADYKEKQRTYAFLCRKGFSGETIRKYMLLDITSNSV